MKQTTGRPLANYHVKITGQKLDHRMTWQLLSLRDSRSPIDLGEVTHTATSCINYNPLITEKVKEIVRTNNNSNKKKKLKGNGKDDPTTSVQSKETVCTQS